MMNNVCLVGRLTKDIEVRFTESGTAIGNFTLAIPRNFKKDETDFINCVAFKADNIQKYAHKGDILSVRGRIQTRSYEDKEGNKKYVTEVIADNVGFVSIKKTEVEEKVEKKEEDPFKEFGDSLELTDEDLPF